MHRRGDEQRITTEQLGCEGIGMMQDAFHRWVVMVGWGEGRAHPGVGDEGGRVMTDVAVSDL